MKNAKIVLADGELIIPLGDEMFDAIYNNEGNLLDLNSDFSHFLESLVPVENKKCCLMVDDVEVNFEVPPHILELLSDFVRDDLELLDEEIVEVHDVVRACVPQGIRPPTVKQYLYAKNIAEILGIHLPVATRRTTDECSSFINKYQESFKEIIREENSFSTEGNRLAKWMAARHFHVVAGLPLEDVARKVKVVKVETVNKYLAQLEEWESNLSKYDDEYKSRIKPYIELFLTKNYDLEIAIDIKSSIKH